MNEKNGKNIPLAVQKKIMELKNIEMQLGHIPPEEWAMKELVKRMSESFVFQAKQLEQQSELLFGDICEELSELGFAPQEIAAIINEHLKYPGGPCYCNEDDVKENIGMCS